MLDERWSEDATEIGEALQKLLSVESSPERVRQAEARDDGRDTKLEAELENFGLFEMEVAPDVLARIAYEIGRALAPVALVEALPASVFLRQRDVSFGFDGVVPAALPRVAVRRADGVYTERLSGTPRRSSAGDLLVQHRAGGEATRAGDLATADRMARLMNLLDAARLVGAGQALLKYGVAYANEREQFGKKIGAFQAVSHQLVDACIALDAAELLVRKAAFTAFERAGGDGAPSPEFAMMVYPNAVEASRLAATTVHQVFGGNGFAMEYDVQLYSRRIRSWSMRRGRPRSQLAELARALLTPSRRDAVRHLWHNDTGMPLPRWAREADKA